MSTLRAYALVALVLTGCGTSSAGTESHPVAQEQTGAETEQTQPEPGPEDEPEPAPPAEEATATPPTPRAPIDPSTLVGYVRGMRGPQARSGTGRLSAVRLAPNASVLSVSDLTFEIRDGQTVHPFHVVVPNAFPHPLVDGEPVTFVAGRSGGGPNGRATLMIRAADGALLLAVDTLPDGWTVERGRRVSREQSAGYREDHHAVVFSHAGVQTTTGYGTWGKITTADGTELLVWGAAAQRELHPGRPAPPDYVGSWLDFAISRVR